MKQRALVVLLPLLLLVGCGSSPKTHFHTLVPEPPAQGASPMPGTGLPIQIGDVNLPGTLDRQSLVTRGPGTTLNVSDQDRWAAPLDELIRRALTSDLRDRLGTGRVLAPGDPRPHGAVLVVALNIQRFSGDSAGDVVLDTDWTTGKTTPGSALQTHHALLHVKAASGSPDAITTAMSQALGQLADEIAAQTAGGGTRGMTRLPLHEHSGGSGCDARDADSAGLGAIRFYLFLYRFYMLKIYSTRPETQASMKHLIRNESLLQHGT